MFVYELEESRKKKTPSYSNTAFENPMFMTIEKYKPVVDIILFYERRGDPRRRARRESTRASRRTSVLPYNCFDRFGLGN